MNDEIREETITVLSTIFGNTYDLTEFEQLEAIRLSAEELKVLLGFKSAE